MTKVLSRPHCVWMLPLWGPLISQQSSQSSCKLVFLGWCCTFISVPWQSESLLVSKWDLYYGCTKNWVWFKFLTVLSWFPWAFILFRMQFICVRVLLQLVKMVFFICCVYIWSLQKNFKLDLVFFCYVLCCVLQSTAYLFGFGLRQIS